MSRAWMPLYIGDFTADTMHLSAIETGIYIRLIMHCWQHGSIPRDDQKLALIAHCSSKQWNRHREVVLGFFRESQHSTLMVQGRVSRERLIFDQKRNKFKANAQKIGTPRARASQSQSQSHSSEPPKSFNPDPVGSELNLTRGISAADAAQECPRDILFNQGLRILIAITGKTPDSARRLIGHWLKMAKDEAVRVVAAIKHAEVNRVADPVAWINRALHPRVPSGAKKPFNEIFDDMREDLKNVQRNSEFDNRPGSSFVRLVPPNRRK